MEKERNQEKQRQRLQQSGHTSAPRNAASGLRLAAVDCVTWRVNSFPASDAPSWTVVCGTGAVCPPG